jgi:hypothetical protein
MEEDPRCFACRQGYAAMLLRNASAAGWIGLAVNAAVVPLAVLLPRDLLRAVGPTIAAPGVVAGVAMILVLRRLTRRDPTRARSPVPLDAYICEVHRSAD